MLRSPALAFFCFLGLLWWYCRLVTCWVGRQEEVFDLGRTRIGYPSFCSCCHETGLEMMMPIINITATSIAGTISQIRTPRGVPSEQMPDAIEVAIPARQSSTMPHCSDIFTGGP